MSTDSGSTVLRSLVGSELSSVVFVRDYVQLAFEPSQARESAPGFLRPPLSGAFGRFDAITLPELEIGDRRLRPGHPGYRDALVEQIGRRLTRVGDDGDHLRFEFDNGVLASVSLAVEDLASGQVEAAILRLDDDEQSWMVWRPANRTD